MILHQKQRSLSAAVKDAYWDAVHDCLVDLFHVPSAKARSLCRDRRYLVDLAPERLRSDIYYHREPFDVARDLTDPSVSRQTDLGDSQTNSDYEQILKANNLL